MIKAQEKLIRDYIESTVTRIQNSANTGLIDPELHLTGSANPRYQESCLTLAIAVRLRVALPGKIEDTTIEKAAMQAMDGWLNLQNTNGSVHSGADGIPDPLATAYGIYAIANSVQLLGEILTPILRVKAEKGLRKAVKYLVKHSVPPGLETLPIKYAALQSACKVIQLKECNPYLEKIRRDAHQEIASTLATEAEGYSGVDAGALSLALTLLVLSIESPSEEEFSLWQRIVQRCLLSTSPGGIFGGGAETSIASLPVTTGFIKLAETIPEAAEIVQRLEKAWHGGFYDSLIDPDIPRLTPIAHLLAKGLTTTASAEKQYPNIEKIVYQSNSKNGSGIVEIGDWLLRIAMGGSIAWIHHKPSGSMRLFGSPFGNALREGPWILKGDQLCHPSISGRFHMEDWNPYQIIGELAMVPIPGAMPTHRRIGFPLLKGKQKKVLDRLVPPSKQVSTRWGETFPYRREIELKDGALTIETEIPGKIMHRFPMVWVGGLFGTIKVDKEEVNAGVPNMYMRVSELIFEGGPWPPWIARFDRPVDILYEPIHGSINMHPMRYLAAAVAVLDILTEDRLHVAWRCG